ncbi:hypothetical protein PILCRDRAFT_645729 [Piloderma croceum F 1598]|uniref:Uncharacterized protein n=1 Tax=Piloderma croceum (strain F 1598) TaxID=765440 RepID=A0A0C3F9A7_PILCF|nr:hypothetical protein PILCRDRAFT_645729 [Piloderma croceum F 1598]
MPHKKGCSSIATHLRVLLPALSTLSTEDFGVEKAIILSGDGFGIDAVCPTRWSLVRLALSGYKHGAGNAAKSTT